METLPNFVLVRTIPGWLPLVAQEARNVLGLAPAGTLCSNGGHMNRLFYGDNLDVLRGTLPRSRLTSYTWTHRSTPIAAIT